MSAKDLHENSCMVVPAKLLFPPLNTQLRRNASYSQNLLYTLDVSILKPTFAQFNPIGGVGNFICPYRMVIFPGNYSDLISKVCRIRGFLNVPFLCTCEQENPFEDIDFVWKPTQFSSKAYSMIDKANSLKPPKRHLVHNHLERIKGLCTKTGLIKSLRNFYSHNVDAILSHYSIGNTTPTTYIVTASCQNQEFFSFAQRFQELQPDRPRCKNAKGKMPEKHCTENIWLVKPAALNQGKGIEIFKNDIGGIRKFLQSKPMGTTWVIQKYIERPLLYKGRKFDIRMWAIITWKAELYYYKMGYIRTSSYEYSLENSANYVHLTNNCLQQHGKEYGKFEDGNTVSFHDFTKFLQVNYPFVDFEKDIIGRIKDIMIDTFLATKDSLNPSKRRNCFEFLGYDFLIDEDFHVWLLEVNTNPYLGVPNKYIEGLLPKMINDMLEIVLDLYMLPANKLPERQILNQFELLYEERSGINQRRSYATSLYPGGETQREPVVKKLCKRPSLEHVLKEVKPESNAIESIISLCETNEDTFVKSPIFSALARKALSAKSDMSDTFRKYVMGMILAMSKNKEKQRDLVKLEIVHLLINSALNSNNKDAIQILSNLCSFNSATEPTAEQRAARRKLIQWGGFVCLWHIISSSSVLSFSQYTTDELELLISSIKTNYKQKMGNHLKLLNRSRVSPEARTIDVSGTNFILKKPSKFRTFPESLEKKVDMDKLMIQLEAELMRRNRTIEEKRKKETHRTYVQKTQDVKSEDVEVLRKAIQRLNTTRSKKASHQKLCLFFSPHTELNVKLNLTQAHINPKETQREPILQILPERKEKQPLKKLKKAILAVYKNKLPTLRTSGHKLKII